MKYYYTILLSLLFFSGLTVVGYADLNDGLVAYYPFDGHVNDVSGNGNHGKAYGDIFYVKGVQMQAASFGGGDDFVRTMSGGVTGNSSRAISFWMKTSNGHTIAVGLGAANRWSANTAFALNIYGSECSIYGGTTPYDENEIQLTNNLLDDKWHHVVVNYDGYNELSIFSDAMKIGHRIRSEGEAYNTSKGIIIGTWYDYNRYFIGQIDDLRIYNRALSELEIRRLYEFKGKISPPLSHEAQVVKTPNLSSKKTKVLFLKDTSPPQILISHPQVTRGVGIFESAKNIIVRGNATDDSGVYEVVVNGVDANLDEKGEFWAEVLLAVGENSIDVSATDTKRNTANEAFTIVRKSEATPSPAYKKLPTQLLQTTGKYYALLIGVQDYPDSSLNNLDMPLHDARQLKSLLIDNYTFASSDVRFLSNPDRATIISTFDELSREITTKDSLLVFYAGHGYWDEKFKQGYWLPSNATKRNRSEWISNGTVRDFIRGIQSKHTLLIADACFSGGIFKTRTAFSDAPTSVQQLHKIPSRKAMTSGTLNEVPDKSVFIQYLTKRLKENSADYLSSEELFSSFRKAVINNSPVNQIPQYGEIRESGDEGGDFIFIRK